LGRSSRVLCRIGLVTNRIQELSIHQKSATRRRWWLRRKVSRTGMLDIMMRDRIMTVEPGLNETVRSSLPSLLDYDTRAPLHVHDEIFEIFDGGIRSTHGMVSRAASKNRGPAENFEEHEIRHTTNACWCSMQRASGGLSATHIYSTLRVRVTRWARTSRIEVSG
jgi:hypothetical protein